MPIEFTLPLTTLEQAVADARANEQVMAAKVEDAKATLKAAKGAWEEAVGEVFRALDEMIADKRQPRIPFDELADGPEEYNAANPQPKSPAGSGGSSGPTADPGEPVTVEVQSVSLDVKPGEIIDAEYTVTDFPALPSGPSWRSLIVSNELECDPSIFKTLEVFGVGTMGELADALQAGRNFNLQPIQVSDLKDAIEAVSQEDEKPIRFAREEEGVTGEGVARPPAKQKDPGEEWEEILDKRADEAAPPPEPDPAKPAKKPRGRKPKAAAVTSEPQPEPKSVEVSVTESTLSMDEL